MLAFRNRTIHPCRAAPQHKSCLVGRHSLLGSYCGTRDYIAGSAAPMSADTACYAAVPCRRAIAVSCAAAGVAEGAAHTSDNQIEDLPAGLRQPSNYYDWHDHWYPVGFVNDFDKETPHRFVLLGMPLVIWYQPQAAAAAGSSSSNSNDGGWKVFADVCPHRLVPLSEGRITSAGLLECPYHGWAFNGSGGCETIPQEGNLTTPRACATAFPCVVRQGLLFVRPKPLPLHPVSKAAAPVALSSSAAAPGQCNGTSSGNGTGASAVSRSNGAATSQMQQSNGYQQQELLQLSNNINEDELPIVAEFDQPGWVFQDTWRDVPYDWSSLLENVLDASHVPFTHHKSISNRNTVGDYNMHLTEQVSEAGFKGLWKSGPRAGALGPQSSWFRPPCYMQHKIDAAETRGFESMVVVYAVPTGPGKCRLINRNAFRFTRGGLAAKLPALVMKLVPDWAIHLGTQVPLEDDQIFLHMGELEYVAARHQGKSPTQAYYLPSRADTYAVAFRRWIQQFGNGGPFGDAGGKSYLDKLAPRLTHKQLLDRYSQHTANCAQCQRALNQVKTARKLLAWGTGITGTLALFSAAVAVSTAVAAAATGGAAAASTAAAGTTVGPIASAFGSVSALLLQLLLTATARLAGVAASNDSATGFTAAAAAAAAAPTERALLWLLAAVAAWLVNWQLGSVESSFYTGVYPPPRNRDKK